MSRKTYLRPADGQRCCRSSVLGKATELGVYWVTTLQIVPLMKSGATATSHLNRHHKYKIACHQSATPARYLEPHKGVTVHTNFFFSFEIKYSLKLSPCFEVCLPLGPNYKELRESLTKKRTPSTNMHKAPMIVKYNAGDHQTPERLPIHPNAGTTRL